MENLFICLFKVYLLFKNVDLTRHVIIVELLNQSNVNDYFLLPLFIVFTNKCLKLFTKPVKSFKEYQDYLTVGCQTIEKFCR